MFDRQSKAMIKAMEANHTAELALSEIRAHEKLCVERSDRVIDNQRTLAETIKSHNDWMGVQTERMHARISRNFMWTISVILFCAVALISAGFGAAVYFGDKLLTIKILPPPGP